MEGRNPYEAPMAPLQEGQEERRSRRILLAWVAVFVLNMAFPLLFGWSLTREHGRIGMMAAASLLLAMGWCICSVARDFATPFIGGAAFVALAQLFPILQMIAGLIGMGVGQALDLADFGDESRPDRILSEFGGFVITIVTGGLLIAAGAGFGLLIRSFTPVGWWHRSTSDNSIST